jgi:hypothetical protein
MILLQNVQKEASSDEDEFYNLIEYHVSKEVVEFIQMRELELARVYYCLLMKLSKQRY